MKIHLMITRVEGSRQSGTVCPVSRLQNRSIQVSSTRNIKDVTCLHCLRIHQSNVRQEETLLDMKRKYLHVQILDGRLYIYADDTAWEDSKEMTLNEFDRDCDIGNVESNTHIRIPLKDFVIE